MEDKDMIICRCEDLTRSELLKYIHQGFTSLEELKRITRCGMGPCQGQTCQQLLIREIAAITGQSVEQITTMKVRPPLKPIKLGVLLAGAEEDGHE